MALAVAGLMPPIISPIISFTDPVLAMVALVSSLIVLAAILFVILRSRH